LKFLSVKAVRKGQSRRGRTLKDRSARTAHRVPTIVRTIGVARGARAVAALPQVIVRKATVPMAIGTTAVPAAAIGGIAETAAKGVPAAAARLKALRKSTSRS
jgi:hypothetical protein